MPIHFRSLLTLKYRDLIKKKFDFLVNYFHFEPGDVFMEVLPLEEFDKFYEFEQGKKPMWFIVGFALSNGRIIILDKKAFPKKKDHKEGEFERVILHELCHMFIRRILWPKQAYIWIQEGLCEYISFGDGSFKIKEYTDFKDLEKKENWDKHNSYQQSGAFFKFLAKEYGKGKVVGFIKKIKERSEEESFKEVFGIELNKVQKEFLTSLKNEKTASSRNSL